MKRQGHHQYIITAKLLFVIGVHQISLLFELKKDWPQEHKAQYVIL